MARNFHIIFACHQIHPLTIYTAFSGLFAISMDGKQRHIVYKFSLAIEIVYITRKLYQFEDKYMHSNYFYRHVLLHFHIKLRLDIKQICVFCIYGITGLGLSIYCVWTWKGTHIFLHITQLKAQFDEMQNEEMLHQHFMEYIRSVAIGSQRNFSSQRSNIGIKHYIYVL